jgi:O-antigen/teichoic acid export membrane protein
VEKKELRLQYSGYIIFAAKLVSIITGLAFQFMLGRAIGESYESNIWFNIEHDLVTYFTLMGSVVPFWVMRYTARKKLGSVKTGIVTNTIISLIFGVAYLATVPFILGALGISADFLPLYFIASVQVAELYAISIMESCLQATRPQAVGFGLIFQQVIKISLGYTLIVYFGIPLLGAVISVVASFAVQVAYYFGLLREEMKAKIEWSYIRQWLKGSLANIYNVVGVQIANFVLLMLYFFGSNVDPNQVGGRGYYGYAFTIAQIIAFSSFLSFALYPKLIADKNREDITTSFKMVLMFAIPMTVGAIALADSYMALFSPELRVASAVLVVLAVDAFITVISGIYGSVLFGFETIDEKAMSFKNLVRSRLFLAFSLPYLQAAIALPTTYFLLATYLTNQPIQAAVSVAAINTLVHAISLIAMYAIVHKTMKVYLPWRSILKFVLASAVMGTVMYLVPHPDRISTTLGMTAVGAGVYLAILFALDRESRSLPLAVLSELKNWRKREKRRP